MMNTVSKRLLWSLAFSSVLPVFSSPLKRDALCPCGYRDSEGNIWRESFESDFTADYETAMDNFWPQQWGPVDRDATTYQLQMDSSNVFPYNDGLGLRTLAYDPLEGTTGVVHSGEIESLRNNIVYGTFRVRSTIPDVSGVCYGIFTYEANPPDPENVTPQEADIEFLTAEPDYYRTIFYSAQPVLVDDETDPDAHKKVVLENVDLTEFHWHRFDWLPGQVNFYLDDEQTSTITKNVPTQPSHLLVNLWSDGGPFWSQGPPTADALVTIFNINAYFNSSSLTETQFNSECTTAGTPVCEI